MAEIVAENRSARQPSEAAVGDVACAVVHGDGVAARCCAHLLNSADVRASWQRSHRPSLPAVMLNDNALTLFRDVAGDQALLCDLPRIRRRIVAWGPDAETLVLDHSAVVVSEEALLDSLRPNLPTQEMPCDSAANWKIFATNPLPAPGVEQHFGSRTAFAQAVELQPGSDSEACWIESLDNGWLFLLSTGERLGSLLAIGAAPDSLLGCSRLIAPQIARLSSTPAEFPAYPRIASPLCGPGWLACGSAAMAFDPICGDGVAHAIREAILAAAIIRAGARENCEEFLALYEGRLTAAFRRHLLLCQRYYESASRGDWWRFESAALQRGLAWCDDKLRTVARSGYRLEGFDLIPTNNRGKDTTWRFRDVTSSV